MKKQDRLDGFRMWLLGLPAEEAAALFAEAEFVPLPVRTVLDQTMEFSFAINAGLASFLSIMKNGKSVEVGLCGSGGFVGLPLTAGFIGSPTRVITKEQVTHSELARANLIAALQNCRN